MYIDVVVVFANILAAGALLDTGEFSRTAPINNHRERGEPILLSPSNIVLLVDVSETNDISVGTNKNCESYKLSL